MRVSERSKRMVSVVQPCIVPILNKYVSPVEVGIITIMAVEISGDLGVCDIFVRSMGGPDGFIKILRKYSKKVSHELSKQVETRRTMVIRFKRDKSTDLLKAIAEHEKK